MSSCDILWTCVKHCKSNICTNSRAFPQVIRGAITTDFVRKTTLIRRMLDAVGGCLYVEIFSSLQLASDPMVISLRNLWEVPPSRVWMNLRASCLKSWTIIKRWWIVLQWRAIADIPTSFSTLLNEVVKQNGWYFFSLAWIDYWKHLW